MTWGRILRIAFVVIACVSLLVNAVIIGLGVRLSERGFNGQFTRGVISMPREIRRTYADGLRANRPELKRLRRDMRMKRRAMLDLASAQPVDRAALAAAMRDLRDATTRLQEASHRAMLSAVPEDQD